MSEAGLASIEGLLSHLVQVVDTVSHKEAVIGHKAEKEKKLRREIERLQASQRDQENEDRKKGRAKACLECVQKGRMLALLGSEHAHCSSLRVSLELRASALEEKVKIQE